eukprot:gene4341-9754_t
MHAASEGPETARQPADEEERLRFENEEIRRELYALRRARDLDTDVAAAASRGRESPSLLPVHVMPPPQTGG